MSSVEKGRSRSIAPAENALEPVTAWGYHSAAERNRLFIASRAPAQFASRATPVEPVQEVIAGRTASFDIPIYFG